MDTKNDDINELTHKIIGCAMQVHRVLGNGFQEIIYQRALAIEMRYAGLEFEREKEMQIYYRDEEIGTRRVDFFVENKVMVELKATEKLEDVHKAQAINYCEAYNIADGLLINLLWLPCYKIVKIHDPNSLSRSLSEKSLRPF